MKVKRINMSEVENKATAFSNTPWVDATAEEETQLYNVLGKIKMSK